MVTRITALPALVALALPFPALAVDCESRLAAIDSRVAHYGTRTDERLDRSEFAAFETRR